MIMCGISFGTRQTPEKVVLVLNCQHYLLLSQADLCGHRYPLEAKRSG